MSTGSAAVLVSAYCVLARRALDIDGVREGLPDRPFPLARRPIEAVGRKSRDQAAEVAKGALGKRQDPGGLGPRRWGSDHGALLLFNGVVQRVAEAQPLPAEGPAVPERGIRERRKPGQRLVEGHGRARASMPESRSMTLMIARFPSRPPPSCCSAVYSACAKDVPGSDRCDENAASRTLRRSFC